MSTTKKAFKEVEAFLRPFQNVLALKDEVEVAGSLENLIAQRKRELADAEAKLANVGASLKAADEEAQKIIADGQADAAKTRAAAERELQSAEGARAKAEEALAAAKAKAADMVADGEKARADALAVSEADRAACASDCQVSIDAAKVRVAALNDDARKAQAVLDGINNQIGHRQNDLAGVKAEIERLRSRFATSA